MTKLYHVGFRIKRTTTQETQKYPERYRDLTASIEVNLVRPHEDEATSSYRGSSDLEAQELLNAIIAAAEPDTVSGVDSLEVVQISPTNRASYP